MRTISRSEAARHLGVSRDALTRLERAGAARVQRNEDGKPYYVEGEVARLAEALRTGAVASPGRGARTARVPPVAQLAAQLPFATPPASAQQPLSGMQFTSPPTEPYPPMSPVSDGDDEVQALRAAEARERAEAARLAAEVDRLRAQVARDDVYAALRDRQRAQRIEAIVRRALPRVGEEDQERLEELLRQRLDMVGDLDGEWLAVAAVVRDAVADVDRQRQQAQRIMAQRSGEQRVQREQALRVAQEAAARAQLAAQEREAQALSAAAQQHRAAYVQQRAAGIAQAIAAEAIAHHERPEIVDAAWRGASAALAQLSADADDTTAWAVGSSSAYQAIAWTREAIDAARVEGGLRDDYERDEVAQARRRRVRSRQW